MPRVRLSRRKGGKGAPKGTGDDDLMQAGLYTLYALGSAGILVAFAEDVPFSPRVLIVAFSACATFVCLFFLLRQPMLRMLSARQPWLTAPVSTPALLWEAAVVILSPGKASNAFLARLLPAPPRASMPGILAAHLVAISPALPRAGREQAAADMAGALQEKGEVARVDKALADAERQQERETREGLAPLWPLPSSSDTFSGADFGYYLLDRRAVPEGCQGDQTLRAASLVSRVLDFMRIVANNEVLPES